MTEEDANTAQVVEEQPQADNVDVADQQSSEEQKLNFKALREAKDASDARADKALQENERFRTELEKLQNQQKPDYLAGDPEDWLTKKDGASFKTDVLQEVKQMLVSVKYPNAQELLTKYGNEIPPRVVKAISDSKDLEAAVEAVQMTPSYIRDHSKEHINVAKAMENSSKPKSTLNVGTTGAVSKGSKYGSMSREERMGLFSRFVSGKSE